MHARTVQNYQQTRHAKRVAILALLTFVWALLVFITLTLFVAPVLWVASWWFGASLGKYQTLRGKL